MGLTYEPNRIQLPIMKPHLRLIGDVHGHYDDYLRLARGAEYSIQLGDMGFNYAALNQLDPEHHQFVAGNHDNYGYKQVNVPVEEATSKFHFVSEDHVYKFKALPDHFMGHFGVWTVPDCEPTQVSGDIFFVRGASSVDKQYRVNGKSWWPEEELSIQQMEEAVELYQEVKPDFVISHECPYHVLEALPWFLGKGWGGGGIIHNPTQQMLEAMLQAHRPKIWVFAHYHRNLWQNLFGTTFICLDIMCHLDIDRHLNVCEQPWIDSND